MTTYPSEIYVRSTDANNTIVGFVKAKYLTDDSGNYIFNSGSEKFNIFVKDANGQYVSYLTQPQQQGTAVPYIVPFDYDPANNWGQNNWGQSRFLELILL